MNVLTGPEAVKKFNQVYVNRPEMRPGFTDGEDFFDLSLRSIQQEPPFLAHLEGESKPILGHPQILFADLLRTNRGDIVSQLRTFWHPDLSKPVVESVSFEKESQIIRYVHYGGAYSGEMFAVSIAIPDDLGRPVHIARCDYSDAGIISRVRMETRTLEKISKSIEEKHPYNEDSFFYFAQDAQGRLYQSFRGLSHTWEQYNQHSPQTAYGTPFEFSLSREGARDFGYFWTVTRTDTTRRRPDQIENGSWQLTAIALINPRIYLALMRGEGFANIFTDFPVYFNSTNPKFENSLTKAETLTR